MKMLIVAAVAIAALTPAGLASARTDSPARGRDDRVGQGQGVLVPPLMSLDEIARSATSSLREGAQGSKYLRLLPMTYTASPADVSDRYRSPSDSCCC